MSQLDFDRYTDLESPVHKWNPRAKIISISILLFSVVSAGEIQQAAAGLAIACLLIRVSKLPTDHVVRFIKWPAIFLTSFMIVLLFTTNGVPVFSVYRLSISFQGLMLGLLFFIRGMAAALLASLIVMTTSFSTNVKALEDMWVPANLIQILVFTYRYVFLLREELQTMISSMESRGFIKKSDFRTALMFSKALAMLFIRSYERANNVFLAMLSRGYTGKISAGRGSQLNGIDIMKSLLIVGAALCIHLL
ncbi:MAG: cobalt ECF transporter T component CbiQ [Candidatus Methanosuratincola petrocarbonis]